MPKTLQQQQQQIWHREMHDCLGHQLGKKTTFGLTEQKNEQLVIVQGSIRRPNVKSLTEERG